MTAFAMRLPGAVRTARDEQFPLVVLLPLLAIPLVGSSPTALDQVVVYIELLFLVMAVRNPIWAVAAILLSELTIRNYYLQIGSLQLTTRLFISLMAPLIVLPALSARGFDAGPRAKAVFLLSLAFFALTFLANLLYSDAAFALKFGRYLYTGIVAVFLVPLAVQNRRDLTLLLGTGFAIAVLSAVVAISQHYTFRGLPLIQLVPNDVVLEGFDAWQGRVLGLAENPVYLTNDLLAFFFAPIALLFLLPGDRARVHLLALGLMTMALYFTETRSWVVGAVPGVIAMAFVIGGEVKRVLLVLVIAGAFGFWLWTGYTGNRYSQGTDEDDSAASRPVLWVAAANTALDNPVLGVGHDKFMQLSPEYAGSVDRSLRETQGAGGVLGNTAPHNDFLNVWLSFGTAALAIFFALFYLTGKNFIQAAKRTSDPLLRGIGIGGLGALVAFAFNSAFHNFFDSTLTLWLMAGFALALTKVVFAEAQQPAEVRP